MDDSAGRDGRAALAERVRALRLTDRIEGAKQGGRSTAWLPWALCLLMAATWVFLGSRWYTRPGDTREGMIPDDGVAAPPASSRSPAMATDAIPSEPTGAEVLSAKGYIVPARRISISPIDVSGRIIRLNIVEGQKVEAGEVLAVLDPTSYEADYREATAMRDSTAARYAALRDGPRPEEVEQIEAELAEARAQEEQARLEYERNRGLGNEALARREYEQALFGYRASRDRVRRLGQTRKLLWPRAETIDEARADTEAAQARVDRAKFRLENCEIKAPVGGTILSKKAEVGNLINPVVGGISTSLCDMADLSDLEVELDVQERDIPKVFRAQACEIRVDAFPGRRYRGYVDRVMPIADRAKGVLPIRVKVVVPPGERQGEFLKPEMGALVTFTDSRWDR